MAVKAPTFGVTQVALVVGDLEKTMREYHDNLGWGPWKLYEYSTPWLRDLTVRGQPAEFTWIGAEVLVGPVWVEILQALEGDSPLSEWHAEHGDGVHHLGFEVETMEEAHALHRQFEAQGAPELMSAWCGDMYLYYMDAKPLITEVWVGSAAELKPVGVYPDPES